MASEVKSVLVPTAGFDNGAAPVAAVDVAPAIVGRFRELAAKVWLGVATEDEMGAAKIEDLVAIKSDGEHVHRALTRRKPRSVDREKREVEHVASDETVDRMGDVIRVAGWDLDAFKQNPVVLWDHRAGEPPIGTAVRVWKEGGAEPFLGIGSRLFDALKYPFADLIARMVFDGDLQAGSVGFLPTKVVRPETAAERAKLGLGSYGVLYECAELLEWSIVTVPANPGAMMRALERLAESGAVDRALIADATREFRRSGRVLVPVTVAGTQSRATDDEMAAAMSDCAAACRACVAACERVMGAMPSGDGADDARSSAKADIVAIKSAVEALTNTLGAELPALREQIGSLARGAALRSALGASQGSPQAPAPTSREVDPAAFYGAALAAAKAKVVR